MLKRIFFFLLIFSLPFQLGLHFWPSSSYVAGFKIDYYSPTLYLFDLFLIINLLLYRQSIYLRFSQLRLRQYLPIFLVFLFNLYRSQFSLSTIYFLIRLFELGLFAFILVDTPRLLQAVKWPFITSLLIVCVLGLAHLLLQHSLQGPFYYLGERLFDSSTPNLARSILFGFNLIRPYSSFSHPNSLAGYLLVSLIILSLLSVAASIKKTASILIFFSFSRVAIFAYLVAFFTKPTKTKLFILFLLLSTLPFYYHYLPAGVFDKEISGRLALLISATKLSASDWLFGIGFNQFIAKLPLLLPASGVSSFTLQPIHNSFLLLVLELGIIPLILVFPFLKKIFNSQFTILNSIVLITSSLDHYWLTLPQNRLVIVLAMVLLFRYGSQRNNHPHRRRLKG